MKTFCFLGLLAASVLVSACSSSEEPGPVERAGRSVDRAVYKVGEGVERVGQKIQNSAE